ncbi:hypothetical protein H2200_002261 [Cladophialophora chaetospira]|uniref:Heterokaryon incompatibility domain-containing protein n=1 Tax=Cladophialophora chaetospira TaxID=386627 RepID=A0AA38XII9_9EURO|nr:hypothetical protein H2200_002261 [Cladophialophora chaetospira]
MRLLYFDAHGELKLTKDHIEDTLVNLFDYAVLSHTWGADEEEVTFEDVQHGNYKQKAGYDKLQFCGKQAQSDGLRYFWVDTCCIDKSSSADLQEAITCMFRWYRDSTKCYVFLADVTNRENGNKRTGQTWKLSLRRSGRFSKRQPAASPESQFEPKWDSAFRKSRYFTRGWTLQELIAPKAVEFFSREGDKLGSKETLEEMIHEITGVPIDALRGSPMSSFPVEQRMRWAANRKTRRKEDKAYCLLGIFDVFMPLIYGEGDNAFAR